MMFEPWDTLVLTTLVALTVFAALGVIFVICDFIFDGSRKFIFEFRKWGYITLFLMLLSLIVAITMILIGLMVGGVVIG